MASDALKRLVESAQGRPIDLDYEAIEDAVGGLNLDLDSGKLDLKDWADKNGYSITADPAARRVTFAAKKS